MLTFIFIHAEVILSFYKGSKYADQSMFTMKPAHASPIEHQATPNNSKEHVYLQGNFTGWIQFRKLVEHGLL